jgi:hypothetical protein
VTRLIRVAGASRAGAIAGCSRAALTARTWLYDHAPPPTVATHNFLRRQVAERLLTLLDRNEHLP